MRNTLFYDGNCPLCAKEITLLRRLKDSSLELIDIHSHEYGTLTVSKTDIELLSVLHLKQADNTWKTGVDASVTAWSHTSYGWLFLPLRWPLLKPVVDCLYQKWAHNRACKLGYKEDNNQAVGAK